MKEEFNVSLKTLFEKKLSFEAYFIIWCLYNKQKPQLIEYVSTCRLIPTEEFEKLSDKGLISINRNNITDNNITYESLSLTQTGKNVFEVDNFDILFNEFRKAYPSFVKDRFSKRPLHVDLKRCKNLYKKIINDSIEMHKLLCRCAILYHEEKKRSGSEMYMQNLATWLHQENYLPYMEEASKNQIIEQKEGGSVLDDI